MNEADGEEISALIMERKAILVPVPCRQAAVHNYYITANRSYKSSLLDVESGCLCRFHII
jgi:hypothetical protein